ncbi:glycosyltransferase [Sulfitobacter dubius]|uniref:D-inositol-3-phosphate glycosyltransferase n=1 Tax=Sulfitobacter dubius TaxID=218673 RepID=A0ABY3ZQY4_9RHOB|nr:glycosyltransferase [Sulfitobacter dubius]UOA16560.1 D-inositol-3-phosphate glycosyltransferase [Sulfitobacter dubius]
MATIYYDLSELFLSAGSKFKYYGIARTVLEVGYELANASADVRFVIFSPAHDRFFEITPRIGAASANGVLELNLPVEAKPIRLRYSHPNAHGLRDTLQPLMRRIARKVSLRRWRRSVPEGSTRDVDLEGQILVSLGRPKMMSDYLVAMDEAGVRTRFFPLLHDMIPLHEYAHPRQSMFARNFAHDNRIVVQHAEKLLTNSVFTKDEIEQFSTAGRMCSLPPVVSVPLAQEMRKSDEPINLDLPDTPYLLGVGVMTGRKNLECLVNAMLLLEQAGRPVPHLILAGAKRKRTCAYVDRPEYASIRDKIEFVLDPNQAELAFLYENALALVIPSFMEGWGLPLGEALWLGTPGIASDIPALREVGGDLAEYFDPADPRSLADIIDQLSTNLENYAILKAKIAQSRTDLRTWQHVAQDILVAVSSSESSDLEQS